MYFEIFHDVARYVSVKLTFANNKIRIYVDKTSKKFKVPDKSCQYCKVVTTKKFSL